MRICAFKLRKRTRHLDRSAAKWRDPGISFVLAILLVTGLIQASAQPPKPTTVRIAVLSLFHPHDLILHPAAGQALSLQLDGQAHTLHPGESVTIHADGRSLTLRTGNEDLQTYTLATMPKQSFELEVPGKLSRLYRGALTLSAAETLQPIVTMDIEVAVASIVQAESPTHAPLEALKA